MGQIICYHNPRCSKSRQTLKLLTAAGCEPKVVEYLKEPLDVRTLRAILKKLGLKAADLLRRKEEAYRQLNLAEKLDDETALIEAMVEHPVLIERPIVVAGSRARLGRPPEKVLEIL